MDNHEKRSLEKELIYSETFKFHSINCDVVFLDLLEFKWLNRDIDKRGLCLRPDKIKDFVSFIRSILYKTKECVMFLSNETYIEDFVEVFDEVLLDEDLQKFFFFLTKN